MKTHSLIPAYRELHRQGKFPGLSVEPYLPRIAELVSASGAKTLLDYGCGAGDQWTKHRWHEAWRCFPMPALYDPAVEDFSTLPGVQFDGVICTDVLEHVPEDELDEVIDDLVRLARLWCFVSVCCRPAKPNKNLPNGKNAHVTLRLPEWWMESLFAAFEGQAEIHVAFTP